MGSNPTLSAFFTGGGDLRGWRRRLLSFEPRLRAIPSRGRSRFGKLLGKGEAADPKGKGARAHAV